MASTEHTRRRAGRLAAYPPYAGKTENELIFTAEDALSIFLDLTHRTEDPGEVIDSLVCDIAKSLMARSGQESVKKAKDGEMEREWSENMGALDPVLMQRIKRYRQVVGVNAAHLA